MNVEHLKLARKQSGMTQKEVADNIGVGQSTYKNYECGIREPNGDTIVELANLFNVTTDYLLGREPAPDPFADLNLDAASEMNVIDKYMSLPPNVRACLMDVLVKLGEIAKSSREQEQPVKQSTTLGTIEDQIEEAAKTKEEASS